MDEECAVIADTNYLIFLLQHHENLQSFHYIIILIVSILKAIVHIRISFREGNLNLATRTSYVGWFSLYLHFSALCPSFVQDLTGRF